MTVLGVAVAVMLVGFGIVIAIAGLRGDVPERAPRREQAPQQTTIPWAQIGLATGAFIGVWVLSGWFVAAVGAAVMVWMVPMFTSTAQRRKEAERRSEAIANWTEMLSDTIATGSGLRSAIATTADFAPAPIRREVRVLATRSQSMSLSNALRLFAADMSDATADFVVAALVTSADSAGSGLPTLLTSVAESTRQSVSMRRRIEATRAKTYSSARMMVLIGVTVLFLLMLFRPPFVEAFDTGTGQLVLLIVVGLFVGGVWSLLKLGEPQVQPRVLSGVEIVE